MGFNGFIQTIVWTITLGVMCSGQFYNNRPYPTYSLDNMPKTGFTCRDKILGGYYADPETQCQMFHVCVKVAGVGTQDYRFLCPNSTAFDQEAQICADWGDVDCEASTLYYGSDNFDLYRIGSNFDSNKRAPYADEEEATFHLQRAETSDARRSKQVVVDQYTKSENALIQNANSFRGNSHPNTVAVQSNQTPRQERTYTENTTPAASYHQSIAANYNYNQNVKTSPAVLYTTTTTTARTVAPAVVQTNNYVKEPQRQQNYNNNYNQNNNDEIFQRSQSSHFYNNRNNGKEEYDEEFVQKTTTTTTIRPQTRTGRNRGRGNIRANNINGIYTDSKRTYTQDTTTTTTTTTPSPQYNSEKVQSARVKNNYNQYIQPTVPTTTSTTSAPEKFYDAYNTALQLQQQQQIAVQHYKNFPPSTTINPAELKKVSVIEEETVNYDIRPTTTPAPQYYNINRNQQTIRNQNNIRPAVPSSTYSPVELGQNQETTESEVLTPRGFSKSPNDGAFNQYQVGPNTYLEKYQTLNRRNNGNENYTPASAHKKFSTLVPKDQYSPTTFKPNTYKKPIEAISKVKQEKLFAPRFNPDSYFALEQTTQRNTSPAPIPYTTTTTTTTTTTSRPQSQQQSYVNTQNIDENDGQYHPELYEKDFAKNKIGQKQRTNTRQPNYNSYNNNNNYNNNNYNNNNNNNNNNYQTPIVSSSSAEEEFLKTDHSQNIAASKLQTLTKQAQQKTSNNPLYDSNKSVQKTPAPVQPKQVQQVKTVSQPQTKLISNAPTISPHIKPTKKAAKKEKDASYDYAYYDSGNSHDYSEYEVIEEFGKTAKKLNKN